MDFKGIIFDLDMTLVDTSSLLTMRDQRLWNQVYQNISKTKIYDGVINLLDQLNDRVKTGIVTSSPRTYAERVIDYHGLNIPLLTAYHDTQKHKPHADPILDGISKLGLKPHEVISIGDEEKDIIASNNAGAKSVLVKWGNSGNNNYAANYHCKSVDELKKLLFENYSAIGDEMVISFILKKTVVERIKVKGEIKKVKTPVWFNMEYNTKSKKAWFVGRNSTPFDIRNLSLSERQDLGEKIEEASGLTKDQTITEEFKEPVISTSETVKENILIQDVSDRFRFPEFKEVFYLGYYHKPTLSGHDETSKQLLKFKDGNEDTINKWISLIIQNCNFPPVDYIVRPLSSEETEPTYDKPLDKLGDALYKKYATDYWPDLLTKSRPTKPLKLLDKTARFYEINNVYSFDNSLFPVSYFNNNSLDILIIDDTITTGTTLKEINRAISASIGDDNYNLYIFTLLRTFDSWSNVDQSNIKLNKIFGSN